MGKLTGKAELAETPADDDLIHVVDVSDTTDDGAGSSKKVQRSNLVGGLTANADTDVSGNSWVVDEDDLTSDLDTKVPTQQSVKAYVDAVAVDDQVASEVEMDELGTATYDDVQDWSNGTQSAGVISGGVITDGGSGTVDVSDVKGILKTTNSATGANVYFDLTGLTGQALTDSNTNYISVDYNSGTPQFVVGTSNTANGRTIFNLGKVYREGTGVDIIDSGMNIYDFTKRVQQHHVDDKALEFASGAVVSETGTLNIGISAGVMYAGMNRIATDAIDTSVADDFEYYYYDGADWQESDQTAIDATQYNNVASGLATLSNNQYGVHWVYKGTDTSTYVVYGQDSYTLVEAQQAQPPTSLPAHVSGFGVLRAKIIIQKSASVFTEIERVDDISFSSGSASNHNELAGLDGGTAGEYYHATSAEYTVLQNTSGSNTGDQDIDDVTPTTTKGDIIAENGSNAVRLAVGTNDQVLTADSAEATGLKWADASAGGASYYDVVLDAGGGGDYTDFSTAMGALTTGQTMFVRTGTYEETTAFNVTTADIKIIGENPVDTILKMNASDTHSTWSGANVQFENITLESASANDWIFTGDNATFDQCHLNITASNGYYAFQFSGAELAIRNGKITDTSPITTRKYYITGAKPLISNNVINSTYGNNSANYGFIHSTQPDGIFEGNQVTCTGQTQAGGMVYWRGIVTGNRFTGTTAYSTAVRLSNDECVVTDNVMLTVLKGVYGAGYNRCIISNNYIDADGNVAGFGIDNDGGSGCVYQGNVIRAGSTSGVGIDAGTGSNCSITGNYIGLGSSGINIDATGASNVVTGNTLANSATIDDAGTDTAIGINTEA